MTSLWYTWKNKSLPGDNSDSTNNLNPWRKIFYYKHHENLLSIWCKTTCMTSRIYQVVILRIHISALYSYHIWHNDIKQCLIFFMILTNLNFLFLSFWYLSSFPYLLIWVTQLISCQSITSAVHGVTGSQLT